MSEPADDRGCVCGRCGLPVRRWSRRDDTTYWKHSGGWSSKPSCGRAPLPVKKP